jgi:nucleoside-diphosphate-sugar epimerase
MADLSGRQVLVTGASGFIGRHLVRRLLAEGCEVSALVRPSGDHRLGAGVRVIELPATADELAERVASTRAAICVHLATCFLGRHEPEDVPRLLDANVVFGTRLAEALMATSPQAAFLNVGTTWQYAGGEHFAPANLYAATKQAFADILRSYASQGLPVGTLTLTDTYGPDDPRPKLVASLVDAVRTGKELAMGPADDTIDLVHVDDVVAAFVALVADGALPAEEQMIPLAGDGTSRWLVTSGEAVSVRTVVDLAGKAAGHPLPVRWDTRPGRSIDLRWTPSQGRPLPGWTPVVTLEDGIRALLTGPSPGSTNLRGGEPPPAG